MITFTIIVCLGVGIAIGMYIASQIGEHICSRTNNKELLENMDKLDKKK